MSFFESPILNSPYEYPSRHWGLDASGQPTSQVVDQRRPVTLITPIPQPRKHRRGQRQMVFDQSAQKLDEGSQQYDLTRTIDKVRGEVDAWRKLTDSRQWKVTPETARLLRHWRHHEFNGPRPFFCQLEAVETVIWLTEVAPSAGRRGKLFLEHLEAANDAANPGLARLALKLATGSGKTMVMAMLIAWQAVNSVRHPNSRRFFPRLLDRHPRHYDQGSSASAPAQRSGQLLPESRTLAQRHAGGSRQGEDRDHQLPRLQAP